MFWADIPRKYADRLAKNLGLDQDQAEIAYYGLQLAWSYLLNLLFTGTLAVLTGTVLQAVVGGSAAAVLRLFAGGAHSSSPWRCALIGALVLTAIGRLAICLAAYTAPVLPYFIVVSTLTALLAVWLLAPVDSPAKPITDPRRRRMLRTLALGVVAGIGLLELALVARYGRTGALLAFAVGLCLMWQGFSMTGTGHRVLGKLDNVFNQGGKGGS